MKTTALILASLVVLFCTSDLQAASTQSDQEETKKEDKNNKNQAQGRRGPIRRY